jgi:Holliday junction resolvase
MERYCVLTLEFCGYHVKRNFRSWGVEDVIAAHQGELLFIQVKNYSKHTNSVLDSSEQEIFIQHATSHGARPIYLYVPKRGQRVWLDILTNEILEFKPFTKEWVKERNRIKKMLANLKNPKKGGSRKKWKEYVKANYQEVKQFIC